MIDDAQQRRLREAAATRLALTLPTIFALPRYFMLFLLKSSIITSYRFFTLILYSLFLRIYRMHSDKSLKIAAVIFRMPDNSSL